jgi:hypothetical protein
MPRSYKKRRSTRRRRNHSRRQQRGGGCGCTGGTNLFYGGGATPVQIALAPSNIPAVGGEVMGAPSNTSLSYSIRGGRGRRARLTRRRSHQRGGGWFSFPDLGTFSLHPAGGFSTSPAIMASNYSYAPVNPSPTDQPIGAYNTANPRII